MPGVNRITYRTENVAIACWKLDPVLAKNLSSPIIVGVYIIDGNWKSLPYVLTLLRVKHGRLIQLPHGFCLAVMKYSWTL